MLKIGQCFLILKKDGDDYTLLNSFYPHEGNYENNEVYRLYSKVQKRLSYWYYHYFRDYDAHIHIGVGTTFKNGSWSLERII
jgi:hypothetical protein